MTRFTRYAATDYMMYELYSDDGYGYGYGYDYDYDNE